MPVVAPLEQSGAEVWHCPVCGGHQGMDRALCGNCHEGQQPKFVSPAASALPTVLAGLTPEGRDRQILVLCDRAIGELNEARTFEDVLGIRNMAEAFSAYARKMKAAVEAQSAVQMIVLPEMGENPLPTQNFRNGHRTPQPGLEIERKWERGDYDLPGTRAADELVQIKSVTV